VATDSTHRPGAEGRSSRGESPAGQADTGDDDHRQPRPMPTTRRQHRHPPAWPALLPAIRAPCGRWRLAQTGSCSPPPAGTTPRGCGTWPQATAATPSPATPIGSKGWRPARREPCSPPPASI